MDHLAHEIFQKINEALSRRVKLLLIAGPPRAGKTRLLAALAEQKGWPAALNISLELSERLLPLSNKERSTRAVEIFKEFTEGASKEELLLDNIEILFNPELELQPLALLKSLARNRLVVSSWPGSHVNGSVSYASKQHPEWHEEKARECSILTLPANKNRTP